MRKKMPIQPDTKMASQQVKGFLNLNDNCILEIFNYLPLNDVCSLSETCRRMHALGSGHFMLKYKSKVMVFVDWLYGNLITFPDKEKYRKCFAKKMRSVTLLKHFSTIAAMQKLNKIYEPKEGAETGSPIKTIRFVNWNVDVSKALLTPISTILQNVESLTFEHTSINADLHGCLFGFLPNLKRLTVLTFTDNDPRLKEIFPDLIWKQQPCPTLEYFAWHKAPKYQFPVKDVFPAAEMKRFLEMNPGIKFVSLRLDTKEQLTSLMATDIPVNELFLTITCQNYDEREAEIAGILNDLKVFCEKQKSIKMINDEQRIRLHLQINGHDFEKQSEQLERLAPYIVGMYFESFILDYFATIFPKLINLKVLQVIEFVPTELMCLLPNLEEVFISCLARTLSHYNREIHILGSRLPKLKKLYLNRYLHRSFNNFLAYGEENFEEEGGDVFAIFKKINTERKKMAGAQKLNVYLEVEQSLRKKKVDYDMVEVLRTQTEAITNPFFKQTHLVDAVAVPDGFGQGCVIQ